jgi:hypothetical protein
MSFKLIALPNTSSRRMHRARKGCSTIAAFAACVEFAQTIVAEASLHEIDVPHDVPDCSLGRHHRKNANLSPIR